MAYGVTAQDPGQHIQVNERVRVAATEDVESEEVPLIDRSSKYKRRKCKDEGDFESEHGE